MPDQTPDRPPEPGSDAKPDEPSMPADRLTHEHIDWLDRRLALADRWLQQRLRLYAVGRAIRWCVRKLVAALAWLIEWWPKLWKALIGMATMLVISEQLGYPVAEWLGIRIAEIVSALSEAG